MTLVAKVLESRPVSIVNPRIFCAWPFLYQSAILLRHPEPLVSLSRASFVL